MRTMLRGKFTLLFMMLGMLLAVPAIAFADNVQNTLAASETGTRTITTDGTTAGTTTVGYRVLATGGDGGPTGSGGTCNASSSNPLSVNFSVANVTATPSSLTFTSCSATTSQDVKFSSTTPGTYTIDPSLVYAAAGGTYQDQSPFTLHVQGTGTSVNDVSGSGTEGESDGSLSAKLVWNNNNVGGKTISFAIDKEKNGTFTTVGSATTDNTTGVATLNNVSLAGLAPGTYDLKATFAGDNNYTGDDSTGTLTVNSANTAPELTVPADITAEATSAAGAVVTYNASATDAEDDPAPTPVCSPTSGSTFPLGTTTVNCSVEDSGGLEDTGSFTVTVVDTTAPELNLPGNITEEATGPGGAAVSFSATADDAVDSDVQVNCTPASGSTFQLGTTTVDCTATDDFGNTANGTFTVTVEDTTAPVIASHGNVTAEATSANGATVTYTSPGTTDAVDGPGTATCLPASGSNFQMGQTTVTCDATDEAGNVADSTTFTVTVADTTAPTLDSHADVSATATTSAGAVVNYTKPSATDAVDSNPTVTCSPAPGATFPIGSTTVSCTAEDASGNVSAAKTFKVNVSVSWSNFLQPINLPDPTTGTFTTAYPQSVFKQGATVPVKFKLTGASAGITDGTFYIKYVRTGSGDGAGEAEAVSTAASTTGNLFRYDATAGQYIFNWSTKSVAAGNWDIKVYSDSDYKNLLGSVSLELKK